MAGMRRRALETLSSQSCQRPWLTAWPLLCSSVEFWNFAWGSSGLAALRQDNCTWSPCPKMRQLWEFSSLGSHHVLCSGLERGCVLTQVRLAWLDLTGTACEKALAEEHVSEGSPVKEEVLSVLRISVLSSVVNVFVCMCSCAPCACLVPTEVRRWC